ncbi:MAG: ImmA/IrrE family metallo-endopeptidase [Blastocatellia bacterium]
MAATMTTTAPISDIYQIARRAERLASPGELLDELDIATPDEIDVEGIAWYCGLLVQYHPLKGCEAMLQAVGRRGIITVRDRAPVERQRFSIAHEIGHWMHDYGTTALACHEASFAREWGEDNPEKRANRFARELLIPARMFRDMAQDRPLNFETVRYLAKTFQTSLTATALRLVELGDTPAMLVCYNRHRRVWYVTAANVPSSLWPFEQPRRQTAAYGLLFSNVQNLKAQEIPASSWFPGCATSRQTIREDSVRGYGGTVLTLLSWENEKRFALTWDGDCA